MNKKFTGLTASGLSHPDDNDTVGENIRLQAAITVSLLKFIVMTLDAEQPKQRILLWDLLAVVTERVLALTSALDRVEISLLKRPAPADGGKTHA